MTQRNLDSKNRWRCITVGFRVSPEENENLNKAILLSGLPKQEYIYKKCINQDIIVQGNPKVYQALKKELDEVLNELKRIKSGGHPSEQLLDTICLINKTMNGLKLNR